MNTGWLPAWPSWSPAELSPLALAFIGDAVWELYIRDRVIASGVRRPRELHRLATRYVSAQAQARLVERLAEDLTPEERDWLRRGRNAKPGHGHRGGDVLVYRHSTGFETLLGYLYGSGQAERLHDICQRAAELLETGAAEGRPDASGRLANPDRPAGRREDDLW
ncbi:MAG: ribonuclease III [Alicyclobacillus sp.]|nr:ribonuclease III [Alicyclobacillus sp.]